MRVTATAWDSRLVSYWVLFYVWQDSLRQESWNFSQMLNMKQSFLTSPCIWSFYSVPHVFFLKVKLRYGYKLSPKQSWILRQNQNVLQTLHSGSFMHLGNEGSGGWFPILSFQCSVVLCLISFLEVLFIGKILLGQTQLGPGVHNTRQKAILGQILEDDFLVTVDPNGRLFGVREGFPAFTPGSKLPQTPFFPNTIVPVVIFSACAKS